MAKFNYKKLNKEKEPTEVGASIGSNVTVNHNFCLYYTQNTQKCQSEDVANA